MLDLSTAGIVQVHSGPDGTKLVARTADGVSVLYDDIESDDETTRAASALVADAYTLFLAGPSFIRQRDARLSMLEPAMHDGAAHQRIHAVLEPGFGFSERDEAVLWINEETGLLGLVHFTIDGLASTRGAHVDVALIGVAFGRERKPADAVVAERAFERQPLVEITAHVELGAGNAGVGS